MTSSSENVSFLYAIHLPSSKHPFHFHSEEIKAGLETHTSPAFFVYWPAVPLTAAANTAFLQRAHLVSIWSCFRLPVHRPNRSQSDPGSTQETPASLNSSPRHPLSVHREASERLGEGVQHFVILLQQCSLEFASSWGYRNVVFVLRFLKKTQRLKRNILDSRF